MALTYIREYQERSSGRSIERAADPGAEARLGRQGAPVRVHRAAEAAGRRRRRLGAVPPLVPLEQRRLAVEAAVVQRQVLTQEEAGMASRLAALELLERKWTTTLEGVLFSMERGELTFWG